MAEAFKGPVIPFGAEVRYKPSTPSDQDQLQTFGPQTVPGIFIRYKQASGGGWPSGDLYVVNWEQMENAEMARDVHVRDIKAEEVIVPKDPSTGFEGAQPRLEATKSQAKMFLI